MLTIKEIISNAKFQRAGWPPVWRFAETNFISILHKVIPPGAAMCIERCKAVRILKQYVFRCPDVWFGQGQPDAGD